MHLIKKYANRKLYHTNRKQYITLDGIARLVQDGDAVRILDNETGDDITASILAQVVLQARGRSAPQLPTMLLTGMIQFGGDTLSNLRRTLFDSLGGTYLIEIEIGRRIDSLVGDQKISTDDAIRWRQLLLSSEFAESAKTRMADPQVDVPSRNDVARLNSQVDALASIIEQILKKQ
ncbi:MAG: polyhydroxyalkanoate synthesis regulator DNA-binding domain-containing protein [Chloroflexales bacterium]